MSLVDLLLNQCCSLKQKIAFKYLRNGEINGPSDEITYVELLNRAQVIASYLTSLNLKNKPVLLIYPTGIDFIESFLGAIFAGAIPIPMQTIGHNNANVFETRFVEIVNDSQVEYVLAEKGLQDKIANIKAFKLKFVDCSEIENMLSPDWINPNIAEEDIAYIQYTSGSTRQPQGVCITHKNIISNCNSIKDAYFDGDGMHVSWLPHYHDMGLVGSIIAPLFIGTTTILMSPQSFLRKPVRWLKAIEYFSATSSGGPVFAYDLLLKTIGVEERKQLNLTSWSVAYCGAEPIQNDILDKFSTAFAVSGFNDINYLPCYGMAEATLFVTGIHGLKTINVDRKALTNNKIIFDDSSSSQTLVCLGNVFDDTRVRIVNPETKEILNEEQQIGEIWIKGFGIAPKYYKKNSNNDPFNHALNNENGYLRSGDLGFLYQDELYVCGRLKDLIIINGVNIYAQDIEYIVYNASDKLELNDIIAFNNSNIDEKESLGLIIGIRKNKIKEAEINILLDIVKEKIIQFYEISPKRIAVVNSREILRTSSGKVRRLKCKEMLRNNQLIILKDMNE